MVNLSGLGDASSGRKAGNLFGVAVLETRGKNILHENKAKMRAQGKTTLLYRNTGKRQQDYHISVAYKYVYIYIYVYNTYRVPSVQCN